MFTFATVTKAICTMKDNKIMPEFLLAVKVDKEDLGTVIDGKFLEGKKAKMLDLTKMQGKKKKAMKKFAKFIEKTLPKTLKKICKKKGAVANVQTLPFTRLFNPNDFADKFEVADLNDASVLVLVIAKTKK